MQRFGYGLLFHGLHSLEGVVSKVPFRIPPRAPLKYMLRVHVPGLGFRV